MESGSNLDDVMLGLAGNDKLYGQAGADSLFGGAGADTLYGGIGNDHLEGGIDNDSLLGEAGDDKLYGNSGHDSLKGGEGNDQLFGGLGRDSLNGEAGNDTLYGGQGNDSLEGAAGNDLYLFEPGFGSDRIYNNHSGDSNQDELRFSGGIKPEDIRVTRTEFSEHINGQYVTSHHLVLAVWGTSDRITVDKFNEIINSILIALRLLVLQMSKAKFINLGIMMTLCFKLKKRLIIQILFLVIN